ncbi:MAG TPA: VWA domain-containing protein [Campylobacterales bacterium]|nr:VWA domain-containing protein [Campylobacterales bacterium]
MSQFSFEYPWVLGLIVLFIVCAVFCKAKAKSLYFPHLNALMLGKRHQNYLLLILKWLGIMLAIVALASPVITKEYTNSKKEGRDIVLIVDTSDSMRERGFDPSNRQKNKFEVVKEVAASFVKKRQNDRVALITFADIAFVASPLTFETEFLQQIIGMQRLGIAGKRTAINDALVQSYSMLEKSKAKSKIIILLTDGVDNVSQVTTEELTSLVEKSKVKLYTIGVGSERDFDGVYLRKIAKAGKGQAYAARNAHMLSKVYDEIDRLEASQMDDKKVVQHIYLFIYPLLFSILLLLFFIYFKTKRSL